jgi:hypothetical protein
VDPTGYFESQLNCSLGIRDICIMGDGLWAVFLLLRIETVEDSCELGNEASGSLKYQEFLECLSSCSFIQDSTPSSQTNLEFTCTVNQ